MKLQELHNETKSLEIRLIGLKKQLKKILKKQDQNQVLKLELNKLLQSLKSTKDLYHGKKTEADKLIQLSKEISNNKHLMQ